jgi:hypothetical protein
MKLFLRSLISGLALVAAGCATPVGAFAPLPAAEQTSRYAEGRPIITSTGQQTIVVLGPAETAVDPSQRITFMILVANKSDAPIDIGPSNISVTTDTGARLHVFSATELEKEARKRANSIRMAAALGAVSNSINAANAGYSNSYGTVSGYGPNGSYAGTYNATTYNSAAASAAQAQANIANQQLLSNANAQAGSVLSHSQSGAMQRETIMPGKSYFTPITIDKIGRAKALVFDVAAGGDTYHVRWSFQMQ